MKLIKALIKLVIGLVVVAAIIVGVLVFLTLDTSKIDYTPSDDPSSVQEILGDDIYDSVERIGTIAENERSTSEDNYLAVSFTATEMNDMVTSYIRENFNENYLKDGDKIGIASGNGVSLSSITFTELNGKLAAIAKVDLFGFYSSSVTLSGTPQMSGTSLIIEFDAFRLGKRMTIKAEKVKSILGKVNLELDTGDIFDLKTLTMTFDLSSILSSVSGKFSDFLTGCKYSMDYSEKTDESDGVLSMKIDTKNIFTNVEEVPSASASYTLPDVDLAELALNGSTSITINEADFNKLISENLDSVSTSFGESVALGNKEFTFGLEKLYYDIQEDEVLSLISINSLKTNLYADVSVSSVRSGDAVTEVDLVVSTIYLGEQSVDSSDFFDKVSIPADTLTGGHSELKVTDFAINTMDETVTITYALA